MGRRFSGIWLLLAVVILAAWCRPAQAMLQPTLGRFMQEDPLGYVDGASHYLYVDSDPICSVDATGEVDGSDIPLLIALQRVRDTAPRPPSPSERAKARVATLGQFCKDLTLCEAIAQYIDQVAKESSSFSAFQDELWATAEAATAQIAQKYRDETTFNHKRDFCPGSCSGFQEAMKWNGAENLRHFAGGLEYGWAGALFQTLQPFGGDYWQWHGLENPLHRATPDRRREGRAETHANLRGAEAYWLSNLGNVADVWRQKFCQATTPVPPPQKFVPPEPLHTPWSLGSKI